LACLNPAREDHLHRLLPATLLVGPLLVESAVVGADVVFPREAQLGRQAINRFPGPFQLQIVADGQLVEGDHDLARAEGAPVLLVTIGLLHPQTSDHVEHRLAVGDLALVLPPDLVVTFVGHPFLEGRGPCVAGAAEPEHDLPVPEATVGEVEDPVVLETAVRLPPGTGPLQTPEDRLRIVHGQLDLHLETRRHGERVYSAPYL
jgi:hypothetical protein